MDVEPNDPDTFTLDTGAYENRAVLKALRVAQHQVRLAQGFQAAPRMLSALVGLEDALSDQIAWLENAAADDRADAEYSGEAERERQAWRPLRACLKTAVAYAGSSEISTNRLNPSADDARVECPVPHVSSTGE